MSTAVEKHKQKFVERAKYFFHSFSSRRRLTDGHKEIFVSQEWEKENARSFSVNVSLYMADRERKIKESISRLANKANLQQNIRW